MQTKYKISEENVGKQTIVISFEDCLVKTSLYKSELPRVDSKFKFQKLSVYICNRNHLVEFLRAAKENFEVILWLNSQEDYAEQLIKGFLASIDFEFDFVLNMS